MELDTSLFCSHFDMQCELQSPLDVLSWDVDTVCRWLHDNGLGKFSKAFRVNDITGDLLFELDHKHLKEMSIKTVGDRAKILLAIARLRSTSFMRAEHTLERSSLSRKTTMYNNNRESFALVTFQPPKRVINRPSPINTEAHFITDLSASENGTISPQTTGSFFSPKISSFIHTWKNKTTTGSNGSVSPETPDPPSSTIEAPFNLKMNTPGTTPNSASSTDIMSFESVRRRCIRVYGDDGTSHVINISDLKTPSEILDKIHQRFGVEQPNTGEYYYCLTAVEESGAVRCLNQERELWKICTQIPPHPLKDKLRLQTMKPTVPGQALRRLYDDLLANADSLNKSLLVNERPSSAVITDNLQVFFPAMDDCSPVEHSKYDRESLQTIQQLVQEKARKNTTSIERPPRSPLRKSSPKNLQLVSTSESECVGEEEEMTIYDTLCDLISTGNSNDDGLMNWIKGDLIGKGSFAEVYYGINPVTGDLMAVKQVEIPNSAAMLERRTKFLQSLTRETEVLKKLRHPNIVGYIGCVCDGNYLNVFLEYVDGGSISHLLSKVRMLSHSDTAHLTTQILKGLEYLHGMNIIHRDIKGANILLTSDRHVKITDFGVSKSLDKVRRFSVQGSIYWMAPELARAQPYSCKADIWSLGCLVLEMLTGEHPWAGLDQIQAMFQIGTGTSTPLDFYLSPRLRSQSIRSPMGTRPSSLYSSSSPILEEMSPMSSRRSSLILDSAESCASPSHYISLVAQKFIEACLQFNPENRPSAKNLQLFQFIVENVDREFVEH